MLAELRGGNIAAEPHLIELAYDELHRLAARYLRSERKDHTLQPTALVNEAYIKLRQSDAMKCVDRSHFYALAASVMKHLLVDLGKAHRAAKRGGGNACVSLNEEIGGREMPQAFDPIALHEALEKLARHSARAESAFRLRFLGGLSVDEAAAELNIAARTVKRDCNFARAWLLRELEQRARE